MACGVQPWEWRKILPRGIDSAQVPSNESNETFMKNDLAYGICALTKTEGKYVKSHIIPLALTRLSRTGEKHVEAGMGFGLKRRASSWYDNSLVTKNGEDILAGIDAEAIDILRKNKLVWSGWGEDKELRSDSQVFGNENVGCRGVKIENAEALQLFYLSVFWRAAASSRPEFKNISLGQSELEDLRERVLLRNPGEFADYPIQLFQLTSIGIPHNRTPLLETKEIADSTASPIETVDYVRIYFDGLVAHVHLPRRTCLSQVYLKTCLRVGEDTIVFLHKADESRTQSDIKEIVGKAMGEGLTPSVPRKRISAAIGSAWTAVADTASQHEFGKR
jgi:hypothetical protein